MVPEGNRNVVFLNFELDGIYSICTIVAHVSWHIEMNKRIYHNKHGYNEQLDDTLNTMISTKTFMIICIIMVPNYETLSKAIEICFT